MKTTELTGAELDYWVAKAEGSVNAKIEDWGGKLGRVCISSHAAFERVPYQPSSNWSDGGRIIERNSEAITMHAGYPDLWPTGSYLLPFLMRAYVASKFGDEVSE